ncbi:unnamed protein product [Penicillium glandicola]
MSTDDKSDGLSPWKWIRGQFHMRPPEDDEPQSWWIASTAIPLVAATTGPLANVMSIVALVMPWRSKIISTTTSVAGNPIQEGYPDPRWATSLNAVSLVCGIVGNAFLLFNFTQIVRYIIALPVTIILWFIAAGILCGITSGTAIYAPPVGIDRVYSQAYWSAVIAAILYFVLSVVLMINMLGYFLGKYPQHFALTDEQRTLILQMTALVVWLLIGAAIFKRVLGISFADALYFSDVTVLTLGYGDIIAVNAVGRGLIWPYAVIGIIILGLVVESIYRFAREVHYDNVIRKHIEQKRQSTFDRSIAFHELESSQEKRPTSGEVITPPALISQKSKTHRHHRHHRPIRNTISALATARRPRILVMREEKDRFDAMRRIQSDTMRFRRWNNLIISIITFGIVWSCGAVVFWQLETITYFEALYFCFTSLLTIGYGDFTPQSNAARPFFVVWSLIAIPTMTMLISEMSETVVAGFKRATEVVADYLVLPQSHVYRTCLGRIPVVSQFILSRQEKKRRERGFPLEGADEAGTRERVESGEASQPDPQSDDLAESHPHQTLEELARDPTPLELAQQLAFAIRRASRQAREGKRKRYSYEEWVEFTRLIQFTDPRARSSQRNQPTSVEGVSKDEDEYGLLNWDWIGENSPMLAKQTEPQWVLDRLCESLIRYVSTQEESRATGGDADSAEEATLRKERDIGLMTTNIPEILLLCMEIDFIIAFNDALKTSWPDHNPEKLKITPINERLNSLPEGTTFDLIVSPANSYARLDGAFDDAISRTFSPQGDYYAVTRAAQKVLYEKWRGFAPPGSCTLVEFPDDLKQNKHGCGWVAICPTMREPDNVSWDREIVYECVWSLLCRVEGHNRAEGEEKIQRILMTPLAAGVGGVSKERWALQTVLALRHFVDAVERPVRWGNLHWKDIQQDCIEVEKTWKPEGHKMNH